MTPAPTASDSSAPSSGLFGSGVIEGRVTFEGTRPNPRPIKMSGDANCSPTKPAVEQGKVIAEDGGMPYVFVYIKKGIDGKYPVPTEPVLLNQVGCMYEPHVFGIQIGQPLKILNSDPTAHNVHSMATKNKAFNVSQPAQNMVSMQAFSRQEIGFKIKCDVHGWMSTFGSALPHPFFAVTDETGRYKIERLPAGEYEVEVWHELYQTVSQRITVKDGETVTLDFVYAKGAKP